MNETTPAPSLSDLLAGRGTATDLLRARDTMAVAVADQVLEAGDVAPMTLGIYRDLCAEIDRRHAAVLAYLESLS